MSEERNELSWLNPKSRAGNVAWALFLAGSSAYCLISFPRAAFLGDQIASGFLAVMFGLGAIAYARIAARPRTDSRLRLQLTMTDGKKPSAAFPSSVVGLVQIVGYYILVLALVFVFFALFKMRTHGWPYFGP
jgi:hypothetical protein